MTAFDDPCALIVIAMAAAIWWLSGIAPPTR